MQTSTPAWRTDAAALEIDLDWLDNIPAVERSGSAAHPAALRFVEAAFESMNQSGAASSFGSTALKNLGLPVRVTILASARAISPCSAGAALQRAFHVWRRWQVRLAGCGGLSLKRRRRAAQRCAPGIRPGIRCLTSPRVCDGRPGRLDRTGRGRAPAHPLSSSR